MGRSRRPAIVASGVIVGLAVVYQFFIPVAAQLYPTELALLIVSIFCLLDDSRARLPNWIPITLGIWLADSVLSDLVNHTDGLDALKGSLRVAFLATCVIGLGYLTKLQRNQAFVLWCGIAVGGFVSVALFPNSAAADGEIWKFGLGTPVSLLTCILISAQIVPRIAQFTILTALAVVHFVLGSRGLSLICLVTLGILLVQSRRPQSESPISLQTRQRRASTRLLIVALLAGAVGLILTLQYDNLALSGALGEKAYAKASYESTGQFGSLATSRVEAYLSIQTIITEPLFGGGSYSVASTDATDNVVALLDSWGYPNVAASLLEGTPAYHSELLGSIAEDGILASAFWLPYAWLLIRTLRSVVARSVKYSPLVTFVCVTGLWDLLFSPFGADRRFWVAATVVLLLAARKEQSSWYS